MTVYLFSIVYLSDSLFVYKIVYLSIVYLSMIVYLFAVNFVLIIKYGTIKRAKLFIAVIKETAYLPYCYFHFQPAEQLSLSLRLSTVPC